jgi:peptidylprolyl isomerase
MNARSKQRIVTLGAILAGAALLSACGSTTSTSSSTADTTSNATTATSASSAQTSKPTVTVPSGPAPTTLESTDLIVGTGAEAAIGDTVTVQYVGVNYADGKQFDASWDDGQPFTFQLGAGAVIKGWDQGVVGMKVGGRRQLIVPPSLGYGDQPQGPIVANETLVFVIDLLSVKS